MAKRKKSAPKKRKVIMDDTVGLMGWGEEELTEQQREEKEYRIISEAEQDNPRAFSARPGRIFNDAVRARFDDLVQKKGYGEGSVDCRLVSDLVFGKTATYPAQIIGSCVASGFMRAWTFRQLAQTIMFGNPQDALGDQIRGFDTIAPFAPFSYGCGRRRGNMRRGDGSYCGVQIESGQKDGVIDCNTPALHRIVGTNARDYPETQSSSLYRKFGSWNYLDDLLPYADYRILESEKMRDSGTALERLKQFKPMMICSSWGFGPQEKHRDGFWIYKRSGSWAHNMTIIGFVIDSRGDVFFIVLNSWGERAHRDGEHFIIPESLFSRWLRSASCLTIGDLDLPTPVPSLVDTNNNPLTTAA